MIFKQFLHFKYSVLVFTMIFLSACAGTEYTRLYEGDTRPDNEVVKLFVPYELEIVIIDNQEFKTPYTPDGKYQIDLLPGKHNIKLSYKEFWGVSTGGAVVVSDIFYFDFVTVAGTQYEFKHNGPNNLARANLDNSVSDITVWLSLTGSEQKIQATRRVAYGSYLNRTIGIVDKVETQGSSVIATTAQQDPLKKLQYWWKMADDKKRQFFKEWLIARSVDGKAVSVENKSTTNSPDDPLEKLKHWWKMADDKQRKSFKDWVADRSVDGKGL